MCVSAEASFAVGTILLPAAAYCVHAAMRKNRSHIPLALIPLFFGIQQYCEGAVWLGLAASNSVAIDYAALGFLFFALAFWPVWIPLSAFFLERKPGRKAVIGSIALLSLGWGIVLFYPLAADPHRWLTIQVVHHSIQYHYFDLPVYQVVSPVGLRVGYFANLALPLVFCTSQTSYTFGLLLGASALISHFVFSHAFVSVWCLFAALLAAYLCVAFHRLESLQAAG